MPVHRHNRIVLAIIAIKFFGTLLLHFLENPFFFLVHGFILRRAANRDKAFGAADSLWRKFGINDFLAKRAAHTAHYVRLGLIQHF
jgi:hypothetical protein